MQRPRPSHACGVVARSAGEATHWLVVSSSTGEHWVLPKGHIERGETAEAAAAREVREEAGVRARPVERLGARAVEDRKGRRIVYFLMEYVGEVVPDEKRTTRWLEAADASTLLSFETDRAALELARSAEALRRAHAREVP